MKITQNQLAVGQKWTKIVPIVSESFVINCEGKMLRKETKVSAAADVRSSWVLPLASALCWNVYVWPLNDVHSGEDKVRAVDRPS